MSDRDETALKLGRRKVNSAVEAASEEAREFCEVAALGAGEISHRLRREEETEHRADPVEHPGLLQITERRAGGFFEARARRLQQFPAVDPFEFAKLREPGSHRERISGKRAGLVDRAQRRQLLHDFRAPSKSADGQPTADDLAERREIGLNAKQFLGPAARHPEASHHFIEDQQRAIFSALVAQSLEKILARKIEAGIRRDRFQDHRLRSFLRSREKRSGRLRYR